MILSIDQYTRPKFLVKPSDYNNIKWNGKSVADNGWFYIDIGRYLIPTDWKVGIMATIVNPNVLDVFTSEENDNYSDYGFIKQYGKWFRIK